MPETETPDVSDFVPRMPHQPIPSLVPFDHTEIRILALDAPGPGGANHRFRLEAQRPVLGWSGVGIIEMQKGPLQEVGWNGATDEALIAIVLARLEAFQTGPYACPQNADAITSLKAALYWMADRKRERQARGVEGTH